METTTVDNETGGISVAEIAVKEISETSKIAEAKGCDIAGVSYDAAEAAKGKKHPCKPQ